MIEQYCAELPTPGDMYLMHKMGCANYTEYLHCQNDANKEDSNKENQKNENNETKIPGSC